MIRLSNIEADETGATLLAHLQAQTFREAYEGVHTSADLDAYCAANYTTTAARELLESPLSICRTGALDDQIAGYYVVRMEDAPVSIEFTAAELKQIYVLSAAFGSGLGGALFDDAIEQIQPRGREGVWLCVSDLNERAKRFYEKLGFERFGSGPTLVVGKDRLPSSILARRIAFDTNNSA